MTADLTIYYMFSRIRNRNKNMGCGDNGSWRKTLNLNKLKCFRIDLGHTLKYTTLKINVNSLNSVKNKEWYKL